jgi:FkbM family methyltransferase
VDYKAKISILRLLPSPLRRQIVTRRYRVEIDTTGEAELLELRKFVKRGQLALDVGSNLGVYAFELGRLTGRVVAFEPNPVLSAFVESLALDGVDVQHIALSSKDGSAELSIPKDAERGHGWASIVPGFVLGDVEKVPVITRRLDSLNMPTISFIKIDVEGLEQEVLKGGLKTIARDLPVLLIEVGAADLDNISSTLSPLGYQGAFFYQQAWRPLAEFEPERFQNMELWQKSVAEASCRRELDFVNNFLFLPPQMSLLDLT